MHTAPTTIVALALALQACATAPMHQSEEAATAAPVTIVPLANATAAQPDVGKLKLKMPLGESCVCESEKTTVSTIFEKGYQALLAGDYDEAMRQFQLYQRLASSPREELEARIGIAYVRMLPLSSSYNPKKARKAYEVILESNVDETDIHVYTLIMLQSLQSLIELQDQRERLEANNALLDDNIKKREEALRRLRELALDKEGISKR